MITIPPVIIANNEFLEESPDVARAFMEATAKGYEYAVENPKEAADMLIEGDNTGSLSGSQDLVYASQEWISGQYVSRRVCLGRHRPGQMGCLLYLVV